MGLVRIDVSLLGCFGGVSGRIKGSNFFGSGKGIFELLRGTCGLVYGDDKLPLA